MNDTAQVCGVSKEIECKQVCILVGPDNAEWSRAERNEHLAVDSTKVSQACRKQTTPSSHFTSAMCRKYDTTEVILDVKAHYYDECEAAASKRRACCFAGCVLAPELVPRPAEFEKYGLEGYDRPYPN